MGVRTGTCSWDAPSADFFASGVPIDTAFWLNPDLDASLSIDTDQGVICAPSFSDLGPNGGAATKAIIRTTLSRGTSEGLRGNPAYTGNKQFQQRIGAIYPEGGDVTLGIEIETTALAWNAFPANTYVWSKAAFVDAGLNSAYRWVVFFESSMRLAVGLYDLSTAGASVAVAAYWTYGLTQGGITQPPAPAAGTPIKLMWEYNGAPGGDRKFRLYVEDPTGPLGGYRLVSTSGATNTLNAMDRYTRGESFLDTVGFGSYITGSGGRDDIKIRDAFLMPGRRPPGASFSVPASHSLTVYPNSDAGDVDPRAFSHFQRNPFATAIKNSDIGVSVLGYGGPSLVGALYTPIDGLGQSQTIGKWNSTRAIVSTTPTSVETQEAWTNGKTLTDASPTAAPGATRAGTSIFFDVMPLNIQLDQMIRAGVRECTYNHNSTNEIVDGVDSPYRTGARDRTTQSPADSPHTAYHPHTTLKDNEDADLCLAFIHYIENYGPPETRITVKRVKIGTEADTYQQWAKANGAVDQAWRYRTVRQAILDYAEQTDRETPIDVVAIGFSHFKYTTSDPYTILQAFLAQCVAWNLPVTHWDPHFLRGVGGWEWARKTIIALCNTVGLTPTVQALPPIATCNEQNGVGEGWKNVDHYFGYKSASDTGDRRRLFGTGIWSGVEKALLGRYMARTGYADFCGITPVNMGREGFYEWDTAKWPWWACFVPDGPEMASGQILRILAECCGRLHDIPLSTDPTVKAWSGTRDRAPAGGAHDGKIWVQINKCAFAGLPTSSAVGGGDEQSALQVRFGAGYAGRTFTFFRCDSTHANYMNLVGWPNQGAINLQRIQPETLTADGSGNVALTGLEHVGTYLLVEAGSLPALSAGTIVGGATTSTSAAINSTVAASGGVAPLSYSWLYRVSGVGSYAPVPGATSESLSLTGLSPSTTYQVKRIATDNAGQTSETSAVSVTTAAAGSGGAVVTGVTVSPATALVAVGGFQQFAATVDGSGNPGQGVVWSIDESGAGSISPAGGFTAPSTPQTVTVRATSTVDPTKSGVAVVSVLSGGIGERVIIYVEGPFVVESTAGSPAARIKRFVGDPLNLAVILKAGGRRINLSGKTPTARVVDGSGEVAASVDVSVTSAVGGELLLSGTVPDITGTYRVTIKPSTDDWTYGPLLLEVEA